MSAVNRGEAELRGLMGVAFAGGEPALPDLDGFLAEIEVLGGRIQHRQRVRTGLAAAALCVAGFGMVAGIAAVAHSKPSPTPMIPAGGGNVTVTTDTAPADPLPTDEVSTTSP